MRWITVVLFLGLAAAVSAEEPAAPTTKPSAIDPGTYRSALERLNGKLAHRPTTGPSTAPAPFRTPAAIFVGAPAECRPNARDGWNEFTKPKMLRWLQENVAGATVEFQCEIESISVTRIRKPDDPNQTLGWRVAISAKPLPFEYVQMSHLARLYYSARVGYSQRPFEFLVDEAAAQHATKVKRGHPIKVVGTIVAVHIFPAERILPRRARGQAAGEVVHGASVDIVLGKVTVTGW